MTRCWILLSSLVTSLTCTTAAATLSATPKRIHPGEAVSVIWHAEPGTKVLWLGSKQQEMPASGAEEVHFSRPSVVSFIFDTNGRIEFHSVGIEVEGIGGDWPLPSRRDYQHPFLDSVADTPFPALCQKIMTQLQNALGFDLPAIFADLNADGSIHSLYFQTNWRRIASLQGGLDRGLRERLITYLLRVDNPGAVARPITYEIRMQIQNRRASDELAEIEVSQNVYDQARSLLRAEVFNRH